MIFQNHIPTSIPNPNSVQFKLKSYSVINESVFNLKEQIQYFLLNSMIYCHKHFEVIIYYNAFPLVFDYIVSQSHDIELFWQNTAHVLNDVTLAMVGPLTQ